MNVARSGMGDETVALPAAPPAGQHRLFQCFSATAGSPVRCGRESTKAAPTQRIQRPPTNRSSSSR
uniref:Uncharacterized protein n=1 Tax=Plectus sambesii TaxID=2011161 RepID=A0A914WZJ7_9BILA